MNQKHEIFEQQKRQEEQENLIKAILNNLDIGN
jgi:hypothetical protein